ncbi:TetR family transcriptional regulator [Candidatus Fermentibacteria bacterium]|nr:TetR family transcriptional regulator [Candidatus Fermentibacteria bacterium]
MTESNKEKLLEAGTNLLAEKTFSEITMDEVAQRSGLTKPMIYYYFENKEGFYKGLAQHLLRIIRGYVEKIFRPGRSLRECLYDMMNERVRFARENPGLSRAMMSMMHDPNIGRLIKKLQDEFGKYAEMIRPVFDAAVESGEIRADVPYTLTMMMINTTGVGYMVRILKGIDEPALPDPDAVVDLIYEGIAPRNSGEVE